jgi:hypothetical protein
MIFRLASMILVLGLTGCSTLGFGDGAPKRADLAMACQVSRCECRAPRSAFSFTSDKPEPVQWRSDGTAYCREGYELSRVQ